MFLNCNYPNGCKIPKGKPNEIKKVKLEIKKGGLRLIVCQNDNIYFAENGYYFGIELPKFLTEGMFGVNIFETIGKINMALLDWNYGRKGQEYSQLSNKQTDLLQTYLLTIR